MRVRSGTNKPIHQPKGGKKGVRPNPVTLPSVKKKPLMDDTELTGANNRVAVKLNPPDDLEEELGKTAPSKENLKRLSTLVKDAGNLVTEIETLEEKVKDKKETLHIITTRTLPTMMRTAGTGMFQTEDKTLKVSLHDFLNGTLPKKEGEKEKAIKWLEKNGAKDLIKTSFSLALGRGQINDAQKVRSSLGKLGVTYTEKEDVHPQSLYAFVREKMKDGKNVPLDTLGLYSGTVAKIELIKV